VFHPAGGHAADAHDGRIERHQNSPEDRERGRNQAMLVLVGDPAQQGKPMTLRRVLA
jgi:hypothetical protein